MSKALCAMAQEIILWSELHSVTLFARYIPRKKNVLEDQLSRPDQILPTEWSLLPRVFSVICEVQDQSLVDFFATQANAKLPLYVSPVPNPMAWK